MASIREAEDKDLDALLALYTHLHDNPFPEKTQALDALWQEILRDPRHHILVAEEEGRLIASCVCVIIPNLTHNQRPYAIIDNVVTHPEYRRKGWATACLHYARQLAVQESCYKMMLLTGSKQEGILRFYEKAGYNRRDKTAFIQWLPYAKGIGLLTVVP